MSDWDAIDEDLAELMSESPVADNHGTSAVAIATSHGVTNAQPNDSVAIAYPILSPKAPRKNLNSRDQEAMSATQAVVADPKEFYYLGMTAHRGILQPGEFVDHEALIFTVERLLGASMEDIGVLFGPGNPDAERLRAKSAIEDKFLELEEDGGNMSLLGSILGFHVRPDDGYCKKMHRALKRARERREQS